MFAASVYIERRNVLKQAVRQGIILLLGNEECGMNYASNCYPFRQDSTFLYYFGIDIPGLAAVIDIDHDQEIVFGDDVSLEDAVWTGKLPPLQTLAESVGV